MDDATTDSEIYIVKFEEKHDRLHPYNLNRSSKLFISVTICSGTLIVSYSSAVFATAVNAVSREFNVDKEVVTLGTTLFVLGFAFGPIIWAPASELRGRKWPLTISMLLGGIFTIGAAVPKSISPLLVCRFFAGVCGAGQLGLVPSVLADVYDDTTRGVAISLYALTVFAGPFIAPFIGGFIVTGNLGWRWTLYFPAILSLVNGLISLVFLRETHAPRLLVKKAVSIRLQTKNSQARAPLETLETNTKEPLQKYFSRPLYMLFTEPVILVVSIYMSFVYGLVYCLLGAYPLVFQGTYNMGQGVGGLPFLGLAIGQLFACTFVIWVHNRYTKDFKNNKNLVIEQRLYPALFGAPVFSIGIFWFGWTGFDSNIHWAVPTVGGVFIGFGVLCVFLPCFNYLVDSYLPLAASTVAANIILRSSVAAAFPLFTRQMFDAMGIQWASTLLGCLAAIMIPIPFALRIYGPRLRKKSKILLS